MNIENKKLQEWAKECVPPKESLLDEPSREEWGFTRLLIPLLKLITRKNQCCRPKKNT